MIAQVRPAALAAWFTAQAQEAGTALPLVLDVREPAEVQHAAVRADGFELLACPMSSVPERLSQLDPERPIACLCHHGPRSQRVAMFLAQQGFERVANIAGGIEAWATELDPGVTRY